MTASRNVAAYLAAIADAAVKARGFLGSSTLEQFSADDKTVFAVIRALEVLGEATKRIPQEFRAQHPEIPWRAMAGIRDKLIHDYVKVNLETVWKTVNEDLPTLLPLINRVLSDSESS